MIFNSARLVRKGEELEHFHPETIAEHDPGTADHRLALAPKPGPYEMIAMPNCKK